MPNSVIPTIAEDASLQERVVEYIAASSAGLEKAAAAEQDYVTKQSAVVDLIPSVVDTMIEHGRIREDEREKLASLLLDPVQTVKLLQKVAAHRNVEEVQQLGTGSNGQTKTASNGHNPGASLSDPYVGVRRSGQCKQSTYNLYSRLGLTPPTED